MREPENNFQSLELRQFISAFRAESVAFWSLCFYIFVEYIRPQGMYPAIDILPWGRLAILSCLASMFLTGNKAIGFGAMDKLFIAFSIIVILSVIFAWDTGASLKWWSTYASWVLMYFCVVSILTTPNRMVLFALFFVLINFKLSQHGARIFIMRGFSFAKYGLSGSPGWFHNSGEFALQMVVMFSMSMSVLLYLRDKIKGTIRWWILVLLFPGTAALSVIGSSSRGGQLALLVVFICFFLKRKNFIKTMFTISIVVVIGMYFLPGTQLARFDTMGEDKTSELRLMHWEHAIDTIKMNPFGIGYRNWIPYYDAVFHPSQLEEIHNSVLQAFVELGYLGGILFIIMLIVALRMNSKTKKEMNAVGGDAEKYVAAIANGVNLGLLGTFIAALFMSVLYYPMFWLAFSMTSVLRHISQKRIIEQSISATRMKRKIK